MSWSQTPHPYTPNNKKPYAGNNRHQYPIFQHTVHKNPEPSPIALRYDQLKTPVLNQPKKAIVFFGNKGSKHLFPLYRDEEIGIMGELQRRVHNSRHDDDRMTTTTQLGLAISQTCEDLFEVLKSDCSGTNGSKTNSLTQTDSTESY